MKTFFIFSIIVVLLIMITSGIKSCNDEKNLDKAAKSAVIDLLMSNHIYEAINDVSFTNFSHDDERELYFVSGTFYEYESKNSKKRGTFDITLERNHEVAIVRYITKKCEIRTIQWEKKKEAERLEQERQQQLQLQFEKQEAFLEEVKKSSPYRIQDLIERGGASANATNRNGFHCLSAALSNPQPLEIVQMLVKHGANINHVQENLETTPLMSAALMGNLPVVKYLVEHGADVLLTNSHYQTAADISAEYRENIETTKFLRECEEKARKLHR